MTRPAPDDWIALARIVKPRGNRGEVAAHDLCDDPERFADGSELTLRRPDGSLETIHLEHAWEHQGRLILKFRGSDSIGDAERFRGSEICVQYADLGPPPEGENYFVDLIGCEAIEDATDRRIGIVEAIQEPGGSLLLEVRDGDREILIPYVDEICVDTDVGKGEIRVRLPDGLEDLNG